MTTVTKVNTGMEYISHLDVWSTLVAPNVLEEASTGVPLGPESYGGLTHSHVMCLFSCPSPCSDPAPRRP